MAVPPERVVQEVGKSLGRPRLSKDALVKLLKEAEDALSKLNQSSTLQIALGSLNRSLSQINLLQHKDKEVRLLVAVCFSEIIRILAPEPPFSDEIFMHIFRLIIGTFIDLADTASPYFTRRTKILESFAALRCCVIMLDIGCEDLVLEMFKVFFSVVRWTQIKHPPVMDPSSTVRKSLLCKSVKFFTAFLTARNKKFLVNKNALAQETDGVANTKHPGYIVKADDAVDAKFTPKLHILSKICLLALKVLTQHCKSSLDASHLVLLPSSYFKACHDARKKGASLHVANFMDESFVRRILCAFDSYINQVQDVGNLDVMKNISNALTMDRQIDQSLGKMKKEKDNPHPNAKRSQKVCSVRSHMNSVSYSSSMSAELVHGIINLEPVNAEYEERKEQVSSSDSVSICPVIPTLQVSTKAVALKGFMPSTMNERCVTNGSSTSQPETSKADIECPLDSQVASDNGDVELLDSEDKTWEAINEMPLLDKGRCNVQPEEGLDSSSCSPVEVIPTTRDDSDKTNPATSDERTENLCASTNLSFVGAGKGNKRLLPTNASKNSSNDSATEEEVDIPI
ncbi:Sister chromatid cohesion protein PDS5 [Musa troglodytarum]|uniref:Sister chromatid cohesion protein PDS5 n=1 Tax=Musa troglodytarum TaxID=320322 RepID=A0A9E7EJA8_9LILI|nr:Sister chromatid cohesion protein PDS5 [Musa troglodytarum]